MTVEDIEKMKESFRNNELFQQSTSVHKELQYEQFTADGELLEGNLGKRSTCKD